MPARPGPANFLKPPYGSILTGVFFLVAAVVLYRFTMTEPYHMDTAMHMQTVHTFRDSGQIRCYFPTRCVSGYSLLPASMLFGDRTLPLTIVASCLAFVYLYFRWLCLVMDRTTAVISSLLMLAIPAGLMTVTHVKEDFIALMYLSASWYVLEQGASWRRRSLSGALFGLALLSKTSVSLTIPFYLGLVLVNASGLGERWGDLLNFAAVRKMVRGALPAAGGFLLVMLLIEPSYFAGIVGDLPKVFTPTGRNMAEALALGFEEYRHGVGNVLFFAQVLGLLLFTLPASPRERFLQVLFLGEWLFSLLFISMMSGVQYRHFLWAALFSVPPMVLAAQRLLSLLRIGPRLRTVIISGLFGCIALVLCAETYPVISMHARFNPVAHFYKELPMNRENAVLLGLESCVPARYFTGMECIGPPGIDVSADQAQQFTRQIDRLLEQGKSIYLLDDFLSLDAHGTLERALGKYTRQTVYRTRDQNFVPMDYGTPLAAIVPLLRPMAPGCDIVYKLDQRLFSQDQAWNAFFVGHYTFYARCGLTEYPIASETAIDERVYSDMGEGRVDQLTLH